MLEYTKFSMRTKWFLSLLTVLTLFIYAQTLGFAFLNYDDDAYVTANALFERIER